MLSNHKLRRHYAKFNRLYFGDTLPPANVYFSVEEIEWEIGAAADALIDGDNIRIRINPLYAHDWNTIDIALLHEMAHIKLWPEKVPHGRRFHTEIARLFALGAYRRLL
jgi:hypothetical protein